MWSSFLLNLFDQCPDIAPLPPENEHESHCNEQPSSCQDELQGFWFSQQ
jgi:hypothetical protein